MSNNPFYGLKEADDELATQWDGFKPLPEPGENELLDSLVERKHLEIADLIRLGARLSQSDVLAFGWPGGIKYRDLLTGRRWSFPGSDFESQLKVVFAAPERSTQLVIVEGETDAARLSAVLKGVDVAVLSTALGWNDRFTETANLYDEVYVALDGDNAGENGSAKILKALGDRAVRWKPPGEDWCALETVPPLPEPPKPAPILVWGDELFELEYPEIPSYFEHGLLPMTGLLLIHGWTGSFKSWLAFDLCVALAEGGRWADFECTVPQARVAILQFEIPPVYYKERMQLLQRSMLRPELFKNIGHFSPLNLPQLVSSDKKQMAAVRDILVGSEVDAVLLDPYRQLIGVRSTNEQEAQQEVVQFARELNREGIATILTHHDSKTGARNRGGSNLDMTAGDVLAGAADTIISVQLPKGDAQESSRRNLRFSKIRNAPPQPPRGFEMKDGVLLYQTEPHDFADDDTSPDHAGEPAI